MVRLCHAQVNLASIAGHHEPAAEPSPQMVGPTGSDVTDGRAERSAGAGTGRYGLTGTEW
jgi:hypothetical protein